MTSMAIAQTTPEVTDETLAAAARAGDRDAFAALAARYRELVFAYAYARLRDREEAEDVAQETFVRAYQSLDRFCVTRCWGVWLMQILRNLCTDAFRRRRGPRIETAQEWVDAGPSPENLAMAEERRRELSAAVARLPEKFRVPLTMHYASGRTYREIAVALGLPESTVVGRMAGAIRLLRRRLCVEDER